MEENVYVCSWSRTDTRWKLWVKSRPAVRGVAPTYAEAEDLLAEAIRDSGGAMMTVLEFDPPLPRGTLQAGYSAPELLLLHGDDPFALDTPTADGETQLEVDQCRCAEADTFFQKPICRDCKCAYSPRSAKPLSLRYAPRTYDGGFGDVSGQGPASAFIFSSKFLAALSDSERHALELLPVTRRGRGREFFELVGPAGPPFVAVAGLPLRGRRCPTCGHGWWAYWLESLDNMHHFVSRADLATDRIAQLPVFTVGTPPNVHLAVTAQRWRELVGKAGTRGLCSEPLGVVPEHHTVRVPRLPTPDRTPLDELRRRMKSEKNG